MLLRWKLQVLHKWLCLCYIEQAQESAWAVTYNFYIAYHSKYTLNFYVLLESSKLKNKLLRNLYTKSQDTTYQTNKWEFVEQSCFKTLDPIKVNSYQFSICIQNIFQFLIAILSTFHPCWNDWSRQRIWKALIKSLYLPTLKSSSKCLGSVQKWGRKKQLQRASRMKWKLFQYYSMV